MVISTSISNISVALLAAQKKMGGASKGSSNPYYKSKYADYGSVLEVVKEPLNDEGISILQSTYSDANAHYVETLLIHTSGEYISSGALRLELSKVTMQDLGAGVTYARRYQLQALLGVPSEDDDAESTMNRAPAKSSPKASEASVAASEPTKAATSFRMPPRAVKLAVDVTAPVTPSATNGVTTPLNFT